LSRPVDLGTTPRKPLTPRQRLALFEAHKGLCCICGLPIDYAKGFVDEHIRPLGLAGSNDLDNRGPAHIHCAAVKTEGDLAAIAKAKRVKAKAIGARPAPKRPMRSAGFPASAKRKANPTPGLPRRKLFAGAD